MRTLLLSSLSILGGLTTVHAQHWVPYGFYAFKNGPQKTETLVEASDETVMEEANEGLVAENSDQLFAYYDLAADSLFYLDPDTVYNKPKTAPSKNPPKERVPRPSRLCSENWWAEGDYLLVWMKKGDLGAPLITTGSATDAVPGALGQPGTHILYGDNHYNYHRSSGVKAGIGGYMGTHRNFSLDLDGLWIFTQTKHFNTSSDSTGSPLIARPFVDITTGMEDAQLVSEPGLFSGSSSARVNTQLWGAELNMGYHPCSRTAAGDLFIGFRYLRLFEKLKVKDEMLPIGTGSGLLFNGLAVNTPDSLKNEDVFRTTNDFFGGQIGARAEWANCWLSFNMFGKVALGFTEEKYKSNGTTTWESTAFGDQLALGGILVQPSNSVQQKKWIFAWVPEVGVNLGIEPLSGLRFLVGYSFMWWSKVVRPGEQIDSNVNPGQIPINTTYYTPALQTARSHLEQKSFWLQSINFGIAFDF